MRLLFNMDRNDYADCTRTFVRNSARSIIIENGKIFMIYSRKFGFYKFPGGGIEKGETPVEAMIRETREEAGLIIIPETIKEYGFVHRIHKSNTHKNECFIQDNFYYLCQAEKETVPQELDDYERKEMYSLEYVDPKIAIETNRNADASKTPYDKIMFEREAKVLETLIGEKYFD